MPDVQSGISSSNSDPKNPNSDAGFNQALLDAVESDSEQATLDEQFEDRQIDFNATGEMIRDRLLHPDEYGDVSTQVKDGLTTDKDPSVNLADVDLDSLDDEGKRAYAEAVRDDLDQFRSDEPAYRDQVDRQHEDMQELAILRGRENDRVVLLALGEALEDPEVTDQYLAAVWGQLSDEGKIASVASYEVDEDFARSLDAISANMQEIIRAKELASGLERFIEQNSSTFNEGVGSIAERLGPDGPGLMRQADVELRQVGVVIEELGQNDPRAALELFANAVEIVRQGQYEERRTRLFESMLAPDPSDFNSGLTQGGKPVHDMRAELYEHYRPGVIDHQAVSANARELVRGKSPKFSADSFRASVANADNLDGDDDYARVQRIGSALRKAAQEV
jgi:hypothetical protein